MKNWADHCSSDEEDDDDHNDVEEVEEEGAKEPAATPDVPTDSMAMSDNFFDGEIPKDAESGANVDPAREGGGIDSEHVGAPPEGKQQRTYDFPTEPPFTAFVGNMSYHLSNPNDLADELTRVAMDILGVEIEVIQPRIMMDRKHDPPRHRGFGYVQVATLEQLQALMKLNGTNATLAGRKVQLDTANHSSSHHGRPSGMNRVTSSGSMTGLRRDTSTGSMGGAGGDIDGSQFRGGRFSNNSQRRGSSRRSFQNSDRSLNAAMDAAAAVAAPADGPAEGPLPQRRSLKLQPRTLPLGSGAEEGAASTSMNQNSNAGSSSQQPSESGAAGGSKRDIFGGARARDDKEWQERRKSEPQVLSIQQNPHPNYKDEAQNAPQIQRRHSHKHTHRGGGREGNRGAGREVGRASGRDGGRSSGREVVRGGGREGGRGSGREGGRGSGREGGRGRGNRDGGRGKGREGGGRHVGGRGAEGGGRNAGGRGDGRPHGRGGKPDNGNNPPNNINKAEATQKEQPVQATEERRKPTVANASAPAQAAPPAVNKVTNKFAALDFDTDSD